MSILRRQSNRSAEDGLPGPQLVPAPPVPLLRLAIQYAGKAGTVEPGGAELAWAPPVAERMEKASSSHAEGEVRSGILSGRFQTGRSPVPRRPYCAGKAHQAIKSRQSRPPGEPSVHLRNLPW